MPNWQTKTGPQGNGLAKFAKQLINKFGKTRSLSQICDDRRGLETGKNCSCRQSLELSVL